MFNNEPTLKILPLSPDGSEATAAPHGRPLAERLQEKARLFTGLPDAAAVIDWLDQPENQNSDFSIVKNNQGEFIIAVHPYEVIEDGMDLNARINSLSARFASIESSRADMAAFAAENFISMGEFASHPLKTWMSGRDALLIGTYGHTDELSVLRKSFPDMGAVHMVEKSLEFVRNLMLEFKENPELWDKNDFILTRADLLTGGFSEKYGLVYCSNTIKSEILGSERLADAIVVAFDSLVAGGYYIGASEVQTRSKEGLESLFVTTFPGVKPNFDHGDTGSFFLLRKQGFVAEAA